MVEIYKLINRFALIAITHGSAHASVERHSLSVSETVYSLAVGRLSRLVPCQASSLASCKGASKGLLAREKTLATEARPIPIGNCFPICLRRRCWHSPRSCQLSSNQFSFTKRVDTTAHTHLEHCQCSAYPDTLPCGCYYY